MENCTYVLHFIDGVCHACIETVASLKQWPSGLKQQPRGHCFNQAMHQSTITKINSISITNLTIHIIRPVNTFFWTSFFQSLILLNLCQANFKQVLDNNNNIYTYKTGITYRLKKTSFCKNDSFTAASRFYEYTNKKITQIIHHLWQAVSRLQFGP